MNFLSLVLIMLTVGLIHALTTDSSSNSDNTILKDCFNQDCPPQTVLCKRRTALSKDKKFVEQKITCLDKHGRTITSSFNKTDNVDSNVTFASISIGIAKNKTSSNGDQVATNAFRVVTSTVATIENSTSVNGNNTTSNSSVSGGDTDNTSGSPSIQNSTDSSAKTPNTKENTDSSSSSTSKDNETSNSTTVSLSDNSTQTLDKNSKSTDSTSGDTGRDISTSQPITGNNTGFKSV